MKDAIHPKYAEVQVTCSCGSTFATRSTVGQGAAHRSLLAMPSVLHGQAEGDGHRRPHRQVPPALRHQDRRRDCRLTSDRAAAAQALRCDYRAFREKGSPGCLFRCSARVDVRCNCERAMRAPRAYVPESVDPERGQPVGAVSRAEAAGARAAVRGLGRPGSGRARPVEDGGRDVDRRGRGDGADAATSSCLCSPASPIVPRPPLAYIGGAMAIEAFSPPLQVHNAARHDRGRGARARAAGHGVSRAASSNGRAFRWLPVLILVGSVGLLGSRARALARAVRDASAWRSRLYGIRAGLAPPAARAASRSARASASPSSARGLLGPLLARAARRCCCRPVRRRRGAPALTLATVGRRRRGRRGHVAAVAAGAARARSRSCSPSGGEASRLGDYVWFLARRRAAPIRSTTCATSRGSRGPRCRCRCGCCGCACADSTAACDQPGVIVPGVLALVILANLLVAARRAAGRLRCRCSCRSRCSRRSRSIRCKRGFSGALDWFGILTFGLLALLMWVLWIDAYVERHAAERRAPLPRYRGGLPAFVPPGQHARRARAHGPVGGARASGAPLQSPRDPQLGGGRDADLGARRDDLAALPRLAPQLPLDGRDRGAAPARERLRREPQPGRAAARRCSITSPACRRVREEATAAARLPGAARAVRTPGQRRPTRPPDGRRPGAAHAAATTPSASCSTVRKPS